MSLRWRVALAMAALAIAITTIFGFSSYRSTRNSLYNSVDRSLESAPNAARGLGGRGGRGDDSSVGDGPGRRGDDGRAFGYQIVDKDGQVINTNLDEPPTVEKWAYSVLGKGPAQRFDTIDVGDDQYRVRTVGSPDGGGVVQIYRSLDETNEVLAGLRLRTALLAATIGALAALLGWWFAGRLTGPLRRLTLATEHVAHTGDLDVAVPTEGDDEVGRLAGGFNAMMAALRASRDDQARLVQDAGHELRTPLTSLRTNIDLLGRYPNLAEDERAKILADVHTETEELTDLVNEIVAIASGELDDEPVTTVDLRAVADDIADRFARRTDRTILVTGPDTAVVAGQPRAVNRAISCLVENATKFDTDGSDIEINIASQSVRVLDRGPGLGDVDPTKLFDRFYRAESSKALPGSGLGLSIVKQVADNHGATVTAADRDGGGAAFAITFPSTPPTDGPGASATSASSLDADDS